MSSDLFKKREKTYLVSNLEPEQMPRAAQHCLAEFCNTKSEVICIIERYAYGDVIGGAE
jgi:hypothetical protein